MEVALVEVTTESTLCSHPWLLRMLLPPCSSSLPGRLRPEGPSSLAVLSCVSSCCWLPRAARALRCLPQTPHPMVSRPSQQMANKHLKFHAQNFPPQSLSHLSKRDTGRIPEARPEPEQHPAPCRCWSFAIKHGLSPPAPRPSALQLWPLRGPPSEARSCHRVIPQVPLSASQTPRGPGLHRPADLGQSCPKPPRVHGSSVLPSTRNAHPRLFTLYPPPARRLCGSERQLPEQGTSGMASGHPPTGLQTQCPRHSLPSGNS